MNFLTQLARRFVDGLRALSPSCREATRLQSDALDRPLPISSRVGVRMHLVLCQWCRRYGTQLRFLRRAVREHPDQVCEAAPHTLSPAARERIQQAIRDEAK